MIRAHPTQRGTVLLIGLLFLLILTVLGISAMQSNQLQERMAGNARDRNVAFQAAEAALRDAENYIGLNSNSFFSFSRFNGTDGFYDSVANPGTFSLYTELEDSSKTRACGAALTGLSAPRCLIELITRPHCDMPGFAILRISARAQGANPNTVVRLQSRYRYWISGCSIAAPGI